MGVFQNNLMGAAAAAASSGGGASIYPHQIANSCRFIGASGNDGTNFMYHTRGTPTNVDKCTISAWVKRGKLGSKNQMFTGAGVYGGGDSWFGFLTANTFRLHQGYQAAAPYVFPKLQSRAVFRDPSAWMHIVLAFDSTQSTAADRNKVYFNGVQYTDWVTDTTNATLNYDWAMNTSGYKLFVGSGGASEGNSWYPFHGSIAEYVFIDGTQYEASDFAETVNGVWQPKDPSGLTFGNNGAYLKFESSSDLGNDSSGNNNDFTVTGVAAHDQMGDSPTFSADDGNGGNFSTLNPLQKMSIGTFSEGNLKYALSGEDAFATTQALTTKSYCEVRLDSLGNYGGVLGFGSGEGINGYYDGVTFQTNYNSGEIYYYKGSSQQSSPGNVGGVVGAGSVVMMAYDPATYKWWVGVDGTWRSSGNPATGANPIYTGSATQFENTGGVFWKGWKGGANGMTVTFNFGQDGTFGGQETAGGNADDTGYGNFKYDVPAGFLGNCTGNVLVAEEIDPAQTSSNYADKQFDVVSYTGNGGTNNITGYEFKPDLVMFKRRDGASNNIVFDSTRGATKYLQTIGGSIATQTTDTSSLTSFNADGFTLGSSSIVNTGSATYYSAGWKAAGGTTETLTAGSINTTAQANADVGFSILQYTPNSTAGATLAHGLGAVPRFILVVRFEAGGASGWIYHAGMGATYRADWNNTGAFATGITYWNNTEPTSSLITLGSGGGNGLYSGSKMIMYAWADKEGAQKFGSFTGNNDADGTFVYTGFKPRMVWIRNTAGGDFAIYGRSNNDTTINPKNASLQLQNMSNSGVAEQSVALDILSNGFKLRATTYNTSAKYVYCAWGSEPFKYATAR